MNQYVVINQQLVEKEKARLSVFDLAIQRGYGIFDYFKTVNNRPLWLEDHLDRFYASSEAMHLAVPVNREQLVSLIETLVEKNNIPDAGIRLTLTGGNSTDGYEIGEPTLLITQSPLVYHKTSFESGVRLMPFDYQRQLAQVKTIDYLQAIHLQPRVKQAGADDILYHALGEVRESPRANIFIVDQHDRILTPAHHILKGITRKKILSFSTFDSEEAVVTMEELLAAKEVFLTSTTKTVLPVLEIDATPVGNGRPGEVTRAVWRRLLEEQGIG